MWEEKNRSNENMKIKIKRERGLEMKGHGCWPSHYPRALLYLIEFSLSNGLLARVERGCKEA